MTDNEVGLNPATLGSLSRCPSRRGNTGALGLGGLLALFICGFSPQASAQARLCIADSLRSITPSGMRIEQISNLDPGPLKAPKKGAEEVSAGALGSESPEFCFLTGSVVTNPATGKRANFAAALPAKKAWNGKFLFEGCGYNCGEIEASFAGGLRQGYAIWQTDDGHTTRPVPGKLPRATDASWMIKSPGHRDDDAIADFYDRAVHTVTQAGKAFTRGFYEASRLTYSYWLGCSDGGREGMVELTQFPDDYDGIIAGAPYFDIANEIVTTLVGIQAQLRNPHASLTPEQFKLLGPAILSKCDVADGVRDGLIQNPAACNLNLNEDLPRCGSGGPEGQCLTADQIDTLKVIFGAVRDPAGKVIYPGFSLSDPDTDLFEWLGFPAAPGSPEAPNPWAQNPEQQPLGWFWVSGTLTNMIYAGGVDFKPLQTPGITFSARGSESQSLHAVIPDATRDLISQRARLGSGALPSATETFFDHGHKLLMYHGYSDGLITPYRTIQYYRALAKRYGGYTKMQRDAELFMVPGMGHCVAGPGPNSFGQMWAPVGENRDLRHDVLAALANWVENKQRPRELIATKYANDFEPKIVKRTMPLCPFPAMARYTGSGDVSKAENWTCLDDDTRANRSGEVGAAAGVNAPLN